jgi:hypothetical protein
MAATKLVASQFNTTFIKTLFDNIAITNNGATPNSKIDIYNVQAGSDDGTVLIVNSANITVDITVSGANGLDTGSEAVSTWYYVWAICNPTTGVVAGLLSVSSTSPTMPSGYTKKRLIGAVRNKSDGNFQKFYQYNYEYMLYSNIVAVSLGSSTTFASVDISSMIPPNSLSRGVYYYLGGYMAGACNGTVKIGNDGTNDFAYAAAEYNAGLGEYVIDNCDGYMPLITINPPTVYYKVGSANMRCYVYIKGSRLNL